MLKSTLFPIVLIITVLIFSFGCIENGANKHIAQKENKDVLKKNNINLNLKLADFENPNDRELFDTIVKEVFKIEVNYDSIESLENPVKNLVYIFDMHFQVMNGGVIQFVDNGSGDSFEEVLVALKEIKALEYVEILEKIKTRFPNGFIPKETDIRRELIDEINENLTESQIKESSDFYEKLDRKYYDSQKLLYKYVIQYTKGYCTE